MRPHRKIRLLLAALVAAALDLGFAGAAQAVVGRPMTPASYAGSARRTSRRTSRRTTRRHEAFYSQPAPRVPALLRRHGRRLRALSRAAHASRAVPPHAEAARSEATTTRAA
jgi:hypothetical protein